MDFGEAEVEQEEDVVELERREGSEFVPGDDNEL